MRSREELKAIGLEMIDVLGKYNLTVKEFNIIRAVYNAAATNYLAKIFSKKED